MSSASPVAGSRRSKDVRRTLAHANPATHSVDVATSRVVNGQLPNESKQLEEGLALIVEGIQIAVERALPYLGRVAITLLRNLCQQNPSEFAETWRKATSTEPPGDDAVIILAQRAGPSVKQAKAFSQA
ncbi:hypothetical protein [Streptosporangium sp. NPDC002721]|uniref:hypothetical protein n=1 Tax=Streptosporangium sp. NPDC002721 TaxID=3366188 RepID=UPI0036BFA012